MTEAARTARTRDLDVLVVGGGVVGLFCAYYLRRDGAGVTVIEEGPLGGPQSCSSGNTGFVGTQGATPLAEPGVLTQAMRWMISTKSPLRIKPRLSGELASWLWQFGRRCNEADARACYGVLLEMKRRSLEILTEVCREPPSLAATFTAPGMIVAFKTASGFERACRSVPLAVERGVPLRVLSDAELRALEPAVEFDVCGALLNAEGAALRTPEFVVAFAEVLRGMGVEVIGEARVTGFEAAGGGPVGAGNGARGGGHDGAVGRVRTTVGDFAPREVVIAAGAWSARLARQLGVGLLLQPAKGYTVTVDTPVAAPRLPVLLSEGKVALMPLGGRLRFGGTLELAGLDTSVSRRRVDGIAGTVRSYLPGLDVTAARQVWTGLRACTPDSLPFIGRCTSRRNVTMACGHGYIGMGLAPVTGKLVAQIVAGERAEMDLAPFLLDRFGRK